MQFTLEEYCPFCDNITKYNTLDIINGKIICSSCKREIAACNNCLNSPNRCGDCKDASNYLEVLNG